MLKSLKFVQGAVAKKDLIPALTHFRIEKGTVRGYNGMLALCSPIPLDMICNPKAEPLIRAISLCEDTVQMSLTPTGRLSIRSGVFKVLVDCVDGDTPHVEPEGEHVEIDGESLIKAFKTVWNFIGDDASRSWANGVLLRGQSAFATNNVTLVEYWVGSNFPREANIPRATVREMIRIGEAPVYAQMNDTSITFHYSDGRWIRSQLFSTSWPDLSKILDTQSNALPLQEAFFPALTKLKPFVEKTGRIVFRDECVATHDTPDEGASHEVPGLTFAGVWNIDMLFCLEGVATHVDWSAYPAPCIFQGERLRGAIVGLRS